MNLKYTVFAWLIVSFGPLQLTSQSSLYYLGGEGFDEINDVVQLSNGSFLLAGASDEIAWLSEHTTISFLDGSDIANNQGGDYYPFLLYLDSTMKQILHAVVLNQGSAEDIRFIKTTNTPRTTTGDVYISGTTKDPDGGYFIGKLNNNFVRGIPTSMEWVVNVKCTEGGYPYRNQPWDVDGTGRVYYVRGDSHAYNWSAMYRLTPDGRRDVVEHWRTHWPIDGGEFKGTPASSFPEGRKALRESAIVFKRDGRCNLRSWTLEEYSRILPDGNGGTKQGLWPLDVLFDGPCDPEDDQPSTKGPGYTGYRPAGIFTYGPSVVIVDRNNGDVLLGMNMRSTLPGGQPDFEPAVIRFDSSGQLLWWSRLYHEVRPDSSKHNSSPDQYVDAIAIDYVHNLIVVNARCHGNNVENFWEGNTINADPNLKSFQNRFTGSSGNIHISWLGKLDINGTLLGSTYVAEMQNSGKGMGGPMTDPLMDGWPSPNSGWPDLNTTRLVPNSMKVSADGHVIIAGQGRRTMTTANAYMKMPKPGNGSTSRWNHFIRQYASDFSRPYYSSLVAPPWDTLNEQPGLEVRVHNFFKTDKGIVFVGQQNGGGNNVNVDNVPDFGKQEYESEDGIIGYFKSPLIESENDKVVDVSTSVPPSYTDEVKIWPNPGSDEIRFSNLPENSEIQVFDVFGNYLFTSVGDVLNTMELSQGVYYLRILFESGEEEVKLWLKQ